MIPRAWATVLAWKMGQLRLGEQFMAEVPGNNMFNPHARPDFEGHTTFAPRICNEPTRSAKPQRGTAPFRCYASLQICFGERGGGGGGGAQSHLRSMAWKALCLDFPWQLRGL